MRLSVAICTWNRSNLLRKALAHFADNVVPPEEPWELLVVNNNCTDDTDSVINSFVDRLPIKQIFEPTPGLSNARNAAVRNAGGEYILWTDDDAVVDQNWLLAYVSAFSRYKHAVFFGGPIYPWFEGTPPKWITSDTVSVIGSAFGAYDFGPVEIAFTRSTLPYGANYAIRMDWHRGHYYDPKLGINPNGIVMGEETMLMSAVIEKGGVGFYLPSAQVRHWVPQSRQSLRFFSSYYIGCGRTQNRMYDWPTGATIFGKPRWLWKKAFRLSCAFFIYRLFSSAPKWIGKLREASIVWGQLIDSPSFPK
jgi:glucosyl-dolichyl phosphate glucuronosyltransferase